MQKNNARGVIVLEQMGYMALGGVIGTLFWLYALGFYFPRKFEEAERKIQATIDEKEALYVDKIDKILEGDDDKSLSVIVDKIKAELPDIDKVFDDKLPSVIEAFKKEIPDINTILQEQLPLITNAIKAELPDIDSILKDKMPMVADALIAKFAGPPDENMVLALKNISQGAYYSIMSDPEIKRSIQGEINGRMNGIVGQLENRFGFTEQEMKMFKELIPVLYANKDKLNMLAGGTGGGQGGGAFDIFRMLMPGAQWYYENTIRF